MRSLSSSTLFGTWATLLLPINDDDSINFDLLEQQILALIDSSVEGIYCNGTAGEFYNQTEEEFDTIANLLAKHCEDSFTPFQIGVSHMSPVISLNRIQRSRHLKPGAFQVILPDEFRGGIQVV